MSKSNLVENVNIRINLEDMKVLRDEANKRLNGQQSIT